VGELGADEGTAPPPTGGTVLISYATVEGDVCVDIFLRSDGTFGFEECRRDAEDETSWPAIGTFSGGVYPTADAALAAAGEAIEWLSTAQVRYQMGTVALPRRRPATIPVGFWCSRQEPDLPDPHDFVDDTWDASQREAVIAHLEAAAVRASYKGFSWCRICGRGNGSVDRTDGTFHWPDGLSHYLRAHGVRLPPSVVQRMLGGSGED
jgi:hypothetical protein